MKAKTRNYLLIFLSVIGAIAWFIADYTERGMVLGTFGGPILLLGTVTIPAIRAILKKD